MASMMVSRRRAARQKCIVEARAYAEGCQAVRCSLRDVTPLGAKLIAEEDIQASGKILVFVPSVGELWAAMVRWQRGRTFGVEFMRGEADFATAEDVSEPDTLAQRVQVAQVVELAKRLPEA
jgi:hypothetical protein